MTFLLYASFVVIQMVLHLMPGKRRPEDRKKAVLADVLQLPLSYFFTMLLNLLSAWIPAAETMAARIAVLLISVILVGTGAELSLEVGSHGNVEHESERAVAGQVLRLLLLLVGQRLAQHLNLILTHILIELLAQQTVHFVHLYGCAILLLNQTHRHHAGTEAGHLSLLAIIFQLFLHLLLIVGGLNGDGHQAVHLVVTFKLNIHFYLRFNYLRFTILFLGCKITHN